jgi:hypothetical protein
VKEEVEKREERNEKNRKGGRSRGPGREEMWQERYARRCGSEEVVARRCGRGRRAGKMVECLECLSKTPPQGHFQSHLGKR